MYAHSHLVAYGSNTAVRRRKRKRVAAFLLQPFDFLVPKRGLEPPPGNPD